MVFSSHCICYPLPTIRIFGLLLCAALGRDAVIREDSQIQCASLKVY